MPIPKSTPRQSENKKMVEYKRKKEGFEYIEAKDEQTNENMQIVMDFVV